jgi:hypothetical protein
LSDTVLKIKNDTKGRLKPVDHKGVTSERHYRCLGPQNFVPPLLHLEIGMVNQAWDNFEDWVDEYVEVVPPAEKAARQELLNARQNLDLAMEEKKESDIIANIDLREKSGAVNLIKAQLRRKNLAESLRDELQVQPTLLNTFISDLKQQQKLSKEKVKT